MIKTILTHVIDAYKRGGRFGEDTLSVQCRFCKQIWTDEKVFSAERIGDQPCYKRIEEAHRNPHPDSLVGRGGP